MEDLYSSCEGRSGDPVVSFSVELCGFRTILQATIMHFCHSNLRTRIESTVKSCDTCQCFKLTGKAYGMLPPREASLTPWQEIAVDLIGPWNISVNIALMLNALTIVDTVTNLVELICVSNKSAAHVGLQLENAWVSCYPRP